MGGVVREDHARRLQAFEVRLAVDVDAQQPPHRRFQQQHLGRLAGQCVQFGGVLTRFRDLRHVSALPSASG